MPATNILVKNPFHLSRSSNVKLCNIATNQTRIQTIFQQRHNDKTGTSDKLKCTSMFDFKQQDLYRVINPVILRVTMSDRCYCGERLIFHMKSQSHPFQDLNISAAMLTHTKLPHTHRCKMQISPPPIPMNDSRLTLYGHASRKVPVI